MAADRENSAPVGKHEAKKRKDPQGAPARMPARVTQRRVAEAARTTVDRKALYDHFVPYIEHSHDRNVRGLKAGVWVLAILPLALAFVRWLTDSNKIAFLILWIFAMFAIAAVLILVAYADSDLKKTLKELKEIVPPVNPEEDIEIGNLLPVDAEGEGWLIDPQELPIPLTPVISEKLKENLQERRQEQQKLAEQRKEAQQERREAVEQRREAQQEKRQELAAQRKEAMEQRREAIRKRLAAQKESAVRGAPAAEHDGKSAPESNGKPKAVAQPAPAPKTPASSMSYRPKHAAPERPAATRTEKRTAAPMPSTETVKKERRKPAAEDGRNTRTALRPQEELPEDIEVLLGKHEANSPVMQTDDDFLKEMTQGSHRKGRDE